MLLVPTLAARLYYRRISVLGREHLPTRGPAMYVALHRNGAVDGMVYHRVVPRAVFLVSVQLVRSVWGRLFFTGIPVAREKDRGGGDRSVNREAMARCVAHLEAGGELAIFPEGTSDLGPRHLPFKSGAARILAAALAHGVRPAVVPLGIFYRAPERIRSDVVVVVGPHIDTTLDPALDDDGRASALMSRITAALESIGIDLESAAALERVERLAGVRAENDAATYYRALHGLAREPLPNTVADAWGDVERAISDGRLAAEYGAPVFSRRPLAWSIGWIAVQAPIVGAAMVVNALPLAAALVAGRRLSDARNTIALWRLLVGLPLLLLWAFGVAVAAIATGEWWVLAGYVALTVLGVALWPELVARWVRIRNHRRAGALRAPLGVVRGWLGEAVPDA